MVYMDKVFRTHRMESGRFQTRPFQASLSLWDQRRCHPSQLWCVTMCTELCQPRGLTWTSQVLSAWLTFSLILLLVIQTIPSGCGDSKGQNWYVLQRPHCKSHFKLWWTESPEKLTWMSQDVLQDSEVILRSWGQMPDLPLGKVDSSLGKSTPGFSIGSLKVKQSYWSGHPILF